MLRPRLLFLFRACLPVLVLAGEAAVAEVAAATSVEASVEASAVQSVVPTNPKERSAYFRRIYDEGNALFHGQHDVPGGLVHYERLEREARAAGDLPWLRSGLWKIAQVRSATGRLEEAAALYESAREIIFAEEGPPSSANHFLVLGNLTAVYRELGHLGAVSIHHATAVDISRLYFTKRTGAPAFADPFTHSDETMLRLNNIGFIGQIFFEEARLRFDSGREKEAIALLEQLERCLGAAPPKNHWEKSLRAESRQHLAAWCDEIGLAGARDHWEAQLLVAEGESGHGSRSWHLGRIRQAARRHADGDDRPARRAEIEDSLARLLATNQTDDAFGERATLARALAREGDLPAALALLDQTLTEFASLQFPMTRARVLLTRADLRLAAGLGGDPATGEDLRDALLRLRAAGRLRDEPEAYLLYARHLRVAGDFAAAKAVLVDAQIRLGRFSRPALLGRLRDEWLALAAALGGPTPTSSPTEATDLQPVEIVTRVREGDAASVRFTVTNPWRHPITGTLRISGPVENASWDQRSLIWRVNLSDEASAREVSQNIGLESLDQARIILRRERSASSSEPAEVSWTVHDHRQTAWWRLASETADRPAALHGENLAVGNPFYSVPLHHALTAKGRAHDGPLNLRVIVEPACRVELVDDHTGDVLAVDAQGDGDFRLAGDVLWRDRDRDGFPDLSPTRLETEGVELHLFPARGDVDHQVRLELRAADGTWHLQTTDTVLGAPAP